MADQDRAILRELCVINGVNYEQLERGGGSKITKLESFFFGCPYIPSGALAYFPALTELRIVNQKITCISGLESCVNLTQLWICEGQLQCIEGLTECTSLISLYLYTNRITRIQGLDQLNKLKTLWLNGNNIETIEGLDSLCNLKELNLAHNRLTIIGHSLDHLIQLTELNLSGNHLSSLSDLVHLSVLPELTTLSLCDPLYPPNPVCTLCNYSTHLLYHIPTLHWLDGVGVASDELRLLVEGVVQRKKRFYRMKIHHIRMQSREQETRIKTQADEVRGQTYCKIREAQRQLKSPSIDGERERALKQAMDALDTHLLSLDSQASSDCEKVWCRAEELCGRWTTELESGGNVRFIPGSPTQPWYQSCVDIVQSRFTVTQDVTAVEVTGVTKVENRLQYTAFNNKLKSELTREAFSSLPSWKTLLDYLFIVQQQATDVHGSNSPVCVTNSVNLADRVKLKQLEKGQSSTEGELLLCKVFVGLCNETTSDRMPDLTGDVNSVCRVREGGQREWLVRDTDLVLTEYIIQVIYSTNTALLLTSCDPCIPTSCGPIHPQLAMLDERTLLTHAKVDSLTDVKELCFHDNHLTRFRLASNLPSLVSLVLSFNELRTAEDLRSMPSLEHLDVSFNKLTALDGIKGLPKLKNLDLRGNQLSNAHSVVTVLRKLTTLEILDLRYNPWEKVPCQRVYVLGCLKSLQRLDGCVVRDTEVTAALRQVASSQLSLTTLMSHTHTHTHTPHSLTLSPLAQLLSTDTRCKPSHLQPLDNWTQTVTNVCVDGMGLLKLTCLDQLPNLRWLSLANNYLTTIDIVSTCRQLEELVVDVNRLQELPALHTLTHLTYLSLSDNNLTSLPSLLPSLTYLNFSYNKVSNLEPLKCCVSLVELFASGNAVSTTRQLFALKALSSLCVCDLTANPVASLSEYRHFVVYHCSSLKALDGTAVEAGEVVVARERMGGRLCQDLIFERHADQDLREFKQLDVTHSGIKVVDLSPVAVFNNLASLNLEHNSLTSFSGLVQLNSLKVLCLNHNRIEALSSSREPSPTSEHVMASLQVLHLAYNGIRNLSALQLGRIPSLRALFLQGNEVSSVEGLNRLHHLAELVLDRNKIKALLPASFESLTALKELHLEENRLKELSHFSPLVNLQRLYLGMNKIQDFNHLERLSPLRSLIELSIVSNPVSRRLQHRGLLIHLLPSLLSLDGVLVSPEERHSADAAFTQQVDVEPVFDVGMNHGSLLKVMNVPFGHSHHHSTGRRPPPDGKRK